MKKPAERLQPLQHIADNRTQQAAARLAESQRRVAQAEAKLMELRGYLRDYQMLAPASCPPMLLENRRAFAARLREAETYQAGALERARIACAEERERWLHRRREQQVLDKLAAIYNTREQRSDERRAQKLMDEAAQRRHTVKNDEY